jgi:hypothetical protein
VVPIDLQGLRVSVRQIRLDPEDVLFVPAVAAQDRGDLPRVVQERVQASRLDIDERQE